MTKVYPAVILLAIAGRCWEKEERHVKNSRLDADVCLGCADSGADD
jgi:hypothetical protein